MTVCVCVQADLGRVKGDLESSEEQLNRFLQGKMERRTSVSTGQVYCDVMYTGSAC